MPRQPDPIHAMILSARRNQILDAATSVFAEKGFHRATVKEIAQAANMADGTLYNYFKGKDDLLLGILNRLNETEQRPVHFAGAEAADFRTFFTAYLRQRMQLLGQNGQVLQALLPELMVNAELRALYYQQVIAPTLTLAERYFAAQGQVRRLDPALAARVLPGMILGLLTMRLLGDQPLAERWEELPDTLAAIILDGLAARP